MKQREINRQGLRRAMGMTLIEIMVVISIGVMLITALLFYVFPSDDRRCQLEANRLAAYLTAASAEALMRDGAARVVFDFRDQKLTREVSRAGADITRELWEADPKAEEYIIKAPVELQNINTPSVPDLNAGTGYINFEGEKTNGAVVTIGLEEAQYSVVVPPRGGDIKVEKGKVGIPGGSGDFERPRMPNLLGYTDKPRKTSGVASAANLPRSMAYQGAGRGSSGSGSSSTGTSGSKSGSSSGSKSSSSRSHGTSKPRPTEYDGPTNDHDDFRPSSKTTEFAPNLDSLGPEPTDLSDNGKDPVEPSDNDLVGSQNNGNTSNSPQGAGTAGYINGVVLETVDVQKPSQLRGPLNSLLQDRINDGTLALVMTTGNQPHLLFGRYSNGSYKIRDYLPTYGLTVVNPIEAAIDGDAGEACPQDARCDRYRVENGEDHMMTLYIAISDEGTECQFKSLEIIEVEVLMQSRASTGVTAPDITLKFSGIIRRSAARAYQISSDQTLADYLDSSGISPDADSNNDGSDDSWSFEFVGDAAQADVDDTPSTQTDVVPPNCE